MYVFLIILGKTRTKDKYRVVYTDFQRLELEKEYCTSRYITIRRKTELAQTLSLSERQVKIWFQNRRAKERKQNKKVSEPSIGGVQHPDYANIMDTKPKLEPGIHLQHSLHSMSSMAAMGMPAMRLHPHHLHGHHHLAVSAHSHQLHQSPHAQLSAAVGTLSMWQPYAAATGGSSSSSSNLPNGGGDEEQRILHDLAAAVASGDDDVESALAVVAAAAVGDDINVGGNPSAPVTPTCLACNNNHTCPSELLHGPLHCN